MTLQQTLLLGSERSTGVPPVPHPVLASAWSALDWSGAREQALLDATAIAGAAALAGASLGPTLSAVAAAPSDTAPEANAAATAVLIQLFDPEFRSLLPEWLETCARAQQRLPAFYLPKILSSAHSTERILLPPVVGARGLWLAAQNPAWQWLGEKDAAPASDAWETGTEVQRLAALRVLRQNDPSVARARVEQTWAEDPPDFREKAVALFSIGLSAADEPFLEKCLRDRRRELRAEAQRLLAGLPGSGLSRRVRERAAPLLVLRRQLLSRKLEVVLPSGFEPAWKWDGIEEKPTGGIGEKAFWTRQILEGVPVRHWTETFNLSLDALISLAVSSEWSDLLLWSWLRSLRVAPDPEIAEALWEPILNNPKGLSPGMPVTQAASLLLEACAPALRWRLVEKQAAQHPLVVWSCLPQLSGIPSLSSARALLLALAPALRDGTAPGGSPHAVLAARLVPPSLREEAAQLLQREAGLTKTADAFLRTLDLRTRLQAAFSS